jgi:uncharacterized membrane protein YccF (DUF307 family)
VRLIGNIIWLVLDGFFLAVGYVIAGVIACILIITIPFGVASFRLAGYALWPFGRVVVDRKKGSGSGIRLIGNVIWLLFGGLWLALGHLVAALLCAITIIGIPCAIAHLRLAGPLMPLGKQIISIDEAKLGGTPNDVVAEARSGPRSSVA